VVQHHGNDLGIHGIRGE